MDLMDELTQLSTRLASEDVEFALCGGLAMAIYSFPRATLDIDIMIQPEVLDRVKKVANDLGFSIEADLMEFKDGDIRICRLTKLLPNSPDPLVLDILLVTSETRHVWETRQKVLWENGEIPVVSPEGLIELKSMRGSGQDQDDIKHLRRIIDEN